MDADDHDAFTDPYSRSERYPWWQRYPIATVLYLIFTVYFVTIFGVFTVMEWCHPFPSVDLYDVDPTFPPFAERAKRAGIRTGCLLNVIVFTMLAICFPLIVYTEFVPQMVDPSRSLVLMLATGGLLMGATALGVLIVWTIGRMLLEAVVCGTRAERPFAKLLRGRTYRCLPTTYRHDGVVTTGKQALLSVVTSLWPTKQWK